MISISPEAVNVLKERLVMSCSEAGIGFRVLVAADERGEKTFSIKIDRAQEGDQVLEAEGVKVFVDPASAAQAADSDYELDYIDEPEGGFVLA